jgi:hypothetical protein
LYQGQYQLSNTNDNGNGNGKNNRSSNDTNVNNIANGRDELEADDTKHYSRQPFTLYVPAVQAMLQRYSNNKQIKPNTRQRQ